MILKRLYAFKEIEKKWQHYWKDNPLLPKEGPKFYCLSMFPYPSGSLHIGHIRVYSITEAIAKYESLQGKQVFSPMGWDSFGLPAENAAIERGINPSDWTEANISQMKAQMQKAGFAFDWGSELSTCSPVYYTWTQHLFLRLYHKGLVYMKEALINWDPVDQTVLANEQVDENGRSWRSGATVERKRMKQWFIKTTHYAQELEEDLNEVDWPSAVKEMQRGWIGKSKGTSIQFKLSSGKILHVFTTQPETLMGVSFVAISPDYPGIEDLGIDTHSFKHMQNKPEVLRKVGEEACIIQGLAAEHPITKQLLPVIVAEYVLSSYGTGAVMGVPGHDSRDFKVASELGFPAKKVIEKGKIVQSGDLDGLNIKEARFFINTKLRELGIGQEVLAFRLKDWLISRQRYWGVPIPIVHCSSCGTVPAQDLPWILPSIADKERWLLTDCPKCGSPAHRESDTMDTFVDSSWYFLRFLDPHNSAEIFNSSVVNAWMPVDLYIGGTEHAIMHLLYARFIQKFLFEEGAVIHREPFSKLLTQGIVMGKSYRLNGKYLSKDEAEGLDCDVTFEKMSKSKKNGVSPDEIVQNVGADTMRLAVLFAAPSEKNIEWDSKLLKTFGKWLKSIWETCEHLEEKQVSKEVKKLIGSVSHSMRSRKLHVAIARLMEMFEFVKVNRSKEEMKLFLVMLHPFAPHLSSELYQRFTSTDIRDSSWPLIK